MSDTKDIELQEKKELNSGNEKTVPGTYYVPYTDIYESSEALTMVMEIPGIKKDAVDIRIEKNKLEITAEIDLDNYGNFSPVYTEYNVGHFTRSFSLSNKVDRDRIEATVQDGALYLKLPKAEEAKPRRISVN